MTAQDREPVGTPEKDPADWTTGDEPMTGSQASYLQTLTHQAGREVPEGLTKAQASELIDEFAAGDRAWCAMTRTSAPEAATTAVAGSRNREIEDTSRTSRACAEAGERPQRGDVL